MKSSADLRLRLPIFATKITYDLLDVWYAFEDITTPKNFHKTSNNQIVVLRNLALRKFYF